MRAFAAVACAAAVAGGTAAPAAAADWALNGTYSAMSNGDWAQTNDVYRDLPVVRSTWTIAMTCTNVITCRGTVRSDAGWESAIAITNSEYVVDRELPGWQLCADGTGRTVTGHQKYRFFPVDERGFLRAGSPVFAGFDQTSGESGACSLNDKTVIEMPFRLEKLR